MDPRINAILRRESSSWPSWGPVLHLTVIGFANREPVVLEGLPRWTEHGRMLIETPSGHTVIVHVCGEPVPESWKFDFAQRFWSEPLLSWN